MAQTPPKAVIEEAINVLEELETVSRRTERERLLQDHKSNDALQTIVRLAVGSTKFYVRPQLGLELCNSTLTTRRAWGRFLKMCGLLSRREVTGNAAKDKLAKLIYSMHPVLAKWCLRVLLHDLQVGVSTKTAEAIWGAGFLLGEAATSARYTFNGCMLGRHKKDLPKKHATIQFPIGAEYKLDGERGLCFVFPADEVVQIVTRTNKHMIQVERVTEFTDQLLDLGYQLNGGEPVFIDGEFIGKSWNAVSTIIRRTKNFNPADFLDQITLAVFDWAPLPDYESGEFGMPWRERKHWLLSTLDELEPLSEATIRPSLYEYDANVSLVGHRIVKTQKGLDRFYDRALDQGYEGMMVKQLDGPYKAKGYRGPFCIKFKAEEEETGVIIDMEPGEGANGRADDGLVAKAERLMRRLGAVKDNGYYLRVRPSINGDELDDFVKGLKKTTKDASHRRVFLTPKGILTYRYSERLGYFVVESNGRTFHVGGGIGYKNGQDDRMKFWRQRKKLIGVKLDFLFQKDPSEVAVARHNRFVRLRHDLEEPL